MGKRRQARVTGGLLRGRLLDGVKGVGVRPATDGIKTALFSLLGGTVEGARVLDLFAGIGSLGIEALSRGAEKVVFVEKNRDCSRIIGYNLKRLELENKSEIYNLPVQDALPLLAGKKDRFHIIFIDPPFNSTLAQDTLNNPLLEEVLEPDSLVVVRHHHRTLFPSQMGSISLAEKRRYGEMVLSFYRRKSNPF